MIEESFAKQQLARMTGLHFFPKEGAAARELKLAIMVAETPTIAERVVDDIVATMHDAPTPKLIREMANDANEKAELKRKMGCVKCDWTGWRHVIRGGYSGVERCGCQG